MLKRILWAALSLGVLAMAGCGRAFTHFVDDLTTHHHHHDWPFDWDRCSDCVTREQLAAELDKRRATRHMIPGSALSLWRRPSDGRLFARAMFDGGHFEVLGQPARSRDRVLLSLRPVQRFGPSPCRVQWFRDGQPVAVHQLERRSDHELAMILEVTALRGLAPGARFAGVACGREIALTGGALTALSQFEAHFREESARAPVGRELQSLGQ